MSDHPAAPRARELTAKEVEAISASAFQSERRIKKAALGIHGAWWVLAEELYNFHEKGYWRFLNYDSLDEFLAQPDLGISRAQFYKMQKTWRDLVVVKKLSPSTLADIEPAKVAEVVPAIMRGEVKPDDALDDAKGLSWRDVKTKYRPEEQGKHGQKPDDSTPLDADAEPERVKCFNCGGWYIPPPPDIDGGEA